jgi:glycine/D-amino acid oxidase-like deaminating enzyme
MTVVGLGLEVLVKLKGRERAREMHGYMERAVDTVGDLVAEHHLDCDYTRPGFLRMATSPAYVDRIQRQIELARSLGIEGIEWLDREAAREQVASELYHGAWWEPRLALVNPLKLVRALKRVNQDLGVTVCEHSPVLAVQRGRTIRLRTPEATVEADKVVLATNAYSHLLPPLRRMQVPAWTYVVATDPLDADQLAAVGWQGRQGVEDARNLIHYYRLTPDDRLLMGGGPVGLSFGRDMNRDRSPMAWSHLERHIGELFPALRGIRVAHRWGGPFSVTTDLTPALGYLGDERCVYSLGCVGHGVSASHLNGQTIRDLVLERHSELTEVPFVNRRVVPWPPEPLRLAISAALRGYLAGEDRWYERGTRG